MAHALHYGSAEHKFFKKMIGKKTTAHKRKGDRKGFCGWYISQQAHVHRGTARHIFLVGGNASSSMFFTRLYANQQIVHSAEYKATGRRDNSAVRFNGNGYGRIQCFVKVKTQIDEFSFYALMDIMKKLEESMDNIMRSTCDKHMVALRPSCGQLRAVNVKDITNACVCAQASDKLYFVSIVPNTIEKE